MVDFYSHTCYTINERDDNMNIHIELLADFLKIGTLDMPYKKWCWKNAIIENKDYIIVVCDTFDYDDYCVSVTEEELESKYNEYKQAPMQQIMGVYQIHMFLKWERV